jgi:hypothetical protein
MAITYRITRFSKDDCFYGLEGYFRDKLFTIDINRKHTTETPSMILGFGGVLKSLSTFKLNESSYIKKDEGITIYKCDLQEVKLNPEDWV